MCTCISCKIHNLNWLRVSLAPFRSYFLPIHFCCKYAIPIFFFKHVHKHFPNKCVDPNVIYLIYSSHFAHYKNHTQSTIIYIQINLNMHYHHSKQKYNYHQIFNLFQKKKPKYIYSQSPKCNWYTCTTNFVHFNQCVSKS